MKLKFCCLPRHAQALRSVPTYIKLFAGASFLPFLSAFPVFAIECLPVQFGPTSFSKASRCLLHFGSQTAWRGAHARVRE